MKRFKQNITNVELVPKEVLRIVFSYLTPYEYYSSIALVCKAFNFSHDSILLNEYNSIYGFFSGGLKANLMIITKNKNKNLGKDLLMSIKISKKKTCMKPA